MTVCKSFLIIYGSQTGQGESIAERIYSETSQMGLDPKLCCMNEINDKVVKKRTTAKILTLISCFFRLLLNPVRF